MIKRPAALLLILLYSVTVMGFDLNLHYCFNHVSSVSLNAPVKSCTLHPVSKMKCCSDRHIRVKVKDAHQGETSSFFAHNVAFQLPFLSFADHSFFAQQGLADNYFNHGPPRPPSNQNITFLKNRIFRI